MKNPVKPNLLTTIDDLKSLAISLNKDNLIRLDEELSELIQKYTNLTTGNSSTDTESETNLAIVEGKENQSKDILEAVTTTDDQSISAAPASPIETTNIPPSNTVEKHDLESSINDEQIVEAEALNIAEASIDATTSENPATVSTTTSIPQEIADNISKVDKISTEIPEEINIEPSVKKKQSLPKPQFMRAKNGMVGKPYSLFLNDLSIQIHDSMTIHEIKNLESIGLTYNKTECKVEGIPTKDGDYKFLITYSIDAVGKPSSIKFSDKELGILINPDPRSLWKEKEPPADEIYKKPHFDYNNQQFQEYSIIAGSQRGRSHAHEGTFRDDDFILSKLTENTFFMAVADGAGSAKYSRMGSKIACKEAEKNLRNALLFEEETIISGFRTHLSTPDEEGKSLPQELVSIIYKLVGETVQEARAAVLQKAKDEGHEARDYSTTFLFSIIIKIDHRYLLLSYAIGDGIIGHLQADKIKLYSNPDGGEFAGQTRFLTMSDVLQTINNRIKVGVTENLSGLYLMTDGITDPKFETDANFKKVDKWKQLEQELAENFDHTLPVEEAKAQFKEWINFWSPGNHDDRTIAFIK